MKPILFNTKMVRAIQDGRKTVTRRILKTDKYIPNDAVFGYTAFTPKNCISCRGTFSDELFLKRYGENFIKLPYKIGDILYVRETWTELETVYGVPYYVYKADDHILHHSVGENFKKWRPSIHMPKEAARIFLRVTDVRVERLRGITEEQAKAEGVPKGNFFKDGSEVFFEQRDDGYYTAGFEHIWDSTIKKSDLDKYGWNANPWVWVIEFERMEVPG